jgi:poly(3-hydroxybutyrate) depolymerase
VPPGCERQALESDCSGEPGISERRTIDVGGETRTYNVSVPASADCSIPAGLLFFFHGLGGNEDNFDAFAPYTDDAGLVFVQPRGSPQSWAGGALGWVPDGFDENVDFVRAIRDEIETEYAIDPYRVWIAGFSQGAFMSAALASPVAMGDEVTGVGIFGGGEEGNVCPGATCYADLLCTIPFFMRTGDADVHLTYTQTLYDGLVDSGWSDAQINFETFPGGHTIRPEDFVEMLDWLDGAYPSL